jgi:predicted aspartyl protease
MIKKIVIPIELLQIEGDGYHLMVKTFLNGKGAILLIDTGASKSVFDKTRIGNFITHSEFETNEQLSTGLGTNSMESHTTVIDEISLGSLVLKNYKAVILDLSHVNLSYTKIGLEPIDGVLGSDILLDYKATIDYGNKQLTLIG